MTVVGNIFAVIGAITVAFIAWRIITDTITMVIVSRIGWTMLDSLGFWRAIPEAMFRPVYGKPVSASKARIVLALIAVGGVAALLAALP